MDLISRADAKALGLKRYFTGEPCCKGHIAERRVSDHGCVACGREKARDPELRNKRREYMRQHQACLRNADRDKSRAALRASYARHREKRVAEKRVQRAADPEPTRQALRRSYAKLKEKRSEGARQYRKKNPELIAALKRGYKAKKRGAEGYHTAADILRLFGEQNGTCAACPGEIANGYHVDHVEPLSAGGSNWPDNLQLLCPTCNLSKGAKPMAEWLAQKARQ